MKGEVTQIKRGDILQIIPGAGWKAVYALESADGVTPNIFRKPVVCFALEEYTDEFMEPGEKDQRIVGLTAGDDIMAADLAPNFLGYEKPNKYEKWDEHWNLWYEYEIKPKKAKALAKA